MQIIETNGKKHDKSGVPTTMYIQPQFGEGGLPLQNVVFVMAVWGWFIVFNLQIIYIYIDFR